MWYIGIVCYIENSSVNSSDSARIYAFNQTDVFYLDFLCKYYYHANIFNYSMHSLQMFIINKKNFKDKND